MKNIICKKKVLILGNSHLTVIKFRKELIKKLVSQGYDVWVSFPNGPFGEGEKSSLELGCRFIELKINRRGKNPLQDVSLFFSYCMLLRKVKPHVVLAYTVKPDVYGGLASRLLRIPFIPNITGLGKGLAESGLVQKITAILYKLAIKKSNCVFFQNEQDREFFKSHKIKYERDCLIPGSGVNLEEFFPLPYPEDNIIRFTYIARVMKAKGIEQFFDAAKYIKIKYPNTEFHVCGYCEEDYREIIKKYEDDNLLIYHGLVDRILDYEKNSHCIVLPTFHPEGISNVLLEGAACARPIITTNRAGCKEVVDDGVTGYLVKERDSQDLIDKIEKFLHLSFNEKRSMGEAGRRKIEKQFDRNLVVNEYLKEIMKIN